VLPDHDRGLAQISLEDPEHMRTLAEQAAEELADAPAEDVIRWAVDTFGERICVTSSMTDAVIIHLASAVQPGIDVVFLDTGYHFAETIGTRDAVEVVYPVNLVNVTPSRTVAEQDAELGPRLYGRNPDLCCYLRKVEPLERALTNYDAWITGVRRDETSNRRQAQVVEWDDRREMVKVNPIVSWTQKQVDDYITTNGVLVNPLVYDGYPSIGCATCTLRVELGADPRSGMFSEEFVRLARSVLDDAAARRRGPLVCVYNRTGGARLLACRHCGELARCARCGAAAAQPRRPLRRPLMDRKAKIPGDRRERIAIGRVQPFGTAIEGKPGGGNCMDPPADPVARLEHDAQYPACFGKAPCGTDPGGAGADHRDINFRWQTRHLHPRC